MTRGTYLLDGGSGLEDADAATRPAVLCLSYTWNDDALKWLALPTDERVRLMLHSLRQIYPDLDVASHILGEPITISWEREPHFMGAFRGNLPGHYRYQRRMFTHFVQDVVRPRAPGHLPRRRRHLLHPGLGRGRGAHGAERGVGRGAPARRLRPPPATRGRATGSPSWRRWSCPSRTGRRLVGGPRLLVGGDVVLVAQGEPDVVEPLHEPPARVVVDLEPHDEVLGGDRLRTEVDRQLHARAATRSSSRAARRRSARRWPPAGPPSTSCP